MEVDDQPQRGACDWSRSQGRLDNLADGQIFANKGMDTVGKALKRHSTLHRATARTQGLPAFSPQCLARRSATKARHERDGGHGGQN